MATFSIYFRFLAIFENFLLILAIAKDIWTQNLDHSRTFWPQTPKDIWAKHRALEITYMGICRGPEFHRDIQISC